MNAEEPMCLTDLADCLPNLASLQLEADDWRALAQQGFVADEQRGSKIYSKLRFRRGDRQVVRGVGSEAKALAVRAELERLQSTRRLQRELKKFCRIASSQLRTAKESLRPLLAQRGFAFHVQAIRRSRSTGS